MQRRPHQAKYDWSSRTVNSGELDAELAWEVLLAQPS